MQFNVNIPLVPSRVFFVKGSGTGRDEPISLRHALFTAGIGTYNRVEVSGILPPACKIISPNEGFHALEAGQIVFCVMAKSATDEPNRLISAAIGVAWTPDKKQYGYLAEHHSCGETARRAGDHAEDLAATMLATTLNIDFDPERDWQVREQEFKASDHIFRTRRVVQSSRGDKKGLWTTVVAAAVFIM